MSQRWADRDLAAAGFLVFSIDHRLAPDGLIRKQHVHDWSNEGIASGRPPQQSNDLKQKILAAYHDNHCNGTVFLVGGSSGATHSLWATFDRDPKGIVPGWPVAGVPQAVVSFSAPCDLSSRQGDDQDDVEHFAMDVRIYTNNRPGWLPLPYSVSPISLVATATGIAPIRLFTTSGDSVPHQQSDAMKLALQNRGAEVVEVTIQGSNLRAFAYWHTKESPTGRYVSDDVIAFLKSQLP